MDSSADKSDLISELYIYNYTLSIKLGLATDDASKLTYEFMLVLVATNIKLFENKTAPENSELIGYNNQAKDVLLHLKSIRPHLTGDALDDAKNCVRSFLVPDYLAYFSLLPKDQTRYDLLPDEELFQLALDYNLSNDLAREIQNTPRGDAHQKWLANPAEPEYQDLSKTAKSEEARKLHSLVNKCLEIIRMDLQDDQRSARLGPSVSKLIEYTVKNIERFSEEDFTKIHATLNSSFYVFVIPQILEPSYKDPKSADKKNSEERGLRQGVRSIYNSVNLFDLFRVSSLLGAHGIAEKYIGNEENYLPKQFERSYRKWQRDEKDFIAACEAGDRERAIKILVAKRDSSTATPAPVTIPAAAAVAVPQPVAEQTPSQPSGTVTSVFGDVTTNPQSAQKENKLMGYDYYVDQRDRARTPLARDVFSRLAELWNPDKLNGILKSDNLLAKKMSPLVNMVAHSYAELGVLPLYHLGSVIKGLFAKRRDKKFYEGLGQQELFQAIHICRIVGEFEKAIEERKIPHETKSAYARWKDRNQEFIAFWNEKNRALQYAQTLSGKLYDEKNPAIRRVYEYFRFYEEALVFGSQNVTIDATIFSADDVKKYFTNINLAMVRFYVDHFDVVFKNPEIEQIYLITAEAKAYLTKRSFEVDGDKNLKHFWEIIESPEDIEYAFRLVQKMGLESEIKELFDREQFDQVSFADYQAWKETGVLPAMYRTAEIEPAPAASSDPTVPVDAILVEDAADQPAQDIINGVRIHYVEVHRSLVSNREGRDGLNYRPLQDEAKLEVEKNLAQDAYQERTRLLMEELANSLPGQIEDIYVVEDKRTTNDEGVQGPKPYNALHILMKDGSWSRIAVCNYIGNMTYIERNAPPYSEEFVLNFDEMRRNPNVWTVPRITERSWLAKLQDYLITPLDELKATCKSRTGWGPLKDALIHSFAAAVMATGSLPPTHKTDIEIEYGQLSGKTTWSRMYHALHRGNSVNGLDGITTFNKLFTMLTEGVNAPMAFLKKFIGKKDPLDAVKINSLCEALENDMGDDNLSADYYLDLITYDPDTRASKDDEDLRRTGRELDLAFQFGVVAIPEGMLAATDSYPVSLIDFRQKAKRQAERITPRNDNNAGQIAGAALPERSVA